MFKQLRKFETIKKTIIAALASLMLAGVLAGASETSLEAAPSSLLILGNNTPPMLVQ